MSNELTVSDQKRLRRQLALVQQAILAQPGRMWTLRELSDVTGSPEASVSARLRELRRIGWTVLVSRAKGMSGLHTYRVLPPTPDIVP